MISSTASLGHPAEIDEIFDDISYSKGSSVIRMLHDYIGDEAFRKGLHNYLTEYSYKNTITENLWSHLAKASEKPVNDVMSSWTLQMVGELVDDSISHEHVERLSRAFRWSQSWKNSKRTKLAYSD